MPPGMAARAVRETLEPTHYSKVITMGCRRFYDPGEAQTRHHIGTNRYRLSENVKSDEFFRLVLRAILIKLSDIEGRQQ